MDKLKKYAKMMIDEVMSAEQYATMASQLHDEELKADYKEMSKQELHHRDVIAHTMKHYIEECEAEQGKNEAMETVYMFICDLCDEIAIPAVSKLSNS